MGGTPAMFAMDFALHDRWRRMGLQNPQRKRHRSPDRRPLPPPTRTRLPPVIFIGYFGMDAGNRQQNQRGAPDTLGAASAKIDNGLDAQ